MAVKDDYLFPEWNAPSNVRAFVSTRKVSPVGPPMNAQQDEGYLQKRKEWLSSWGEHLVDLWGWDVQPCWALQVHGPDVIPADSAFGTKGDAVWTSDRNHPCTVLTADCLPVLFCNKSGSKVAAAHAGWRGLAGGVLENTIAALDEPGENLMAWLGPAISQSCFEIGPEVREAFLKHSPDAEQAFVAGEGDRWFADLYQLARLRLSACGVSEVSGGEYCTVTEKELFHSYRREGLVGGRLLSAIWLR